MNPDIESHFRTFYLQSICYKYFENWYLGVYHHGGKNPSYQTGYHVKLLDYSQPTGSSRYIYLGATIEESCCFIAKLPPKIEGV